MKNRSVSVGLVIAALVVGASSAHAQSPIGFGVSGGAALATGSTLDDFNHGFNGTVSAFLGAPLTPLTLRIDGSYNKLSGRDGVPTLGRDLGILGASANVQYGLGGIAVKPYAVGGVGVYSTKLGDADRSGAKFGFNGGLGISFGLSGFQTFAEARYTRISTDGEATSFIPLTFGIRF